MDFIVKKVDDRAIMPTKKMPFDAGYDLYALRDVTLDPWSQLVVDTGLELVELPTFNDKWCSVLQIWPRSGLDARQGIHTGAGIIDFLYTGKILVLVKNQSDFQVTINYGTAIAQAVIVPVWAGDAAGEKRRGDSGGIAEFHRGGSMNFMYTYTPKVE